MGPGNSQHLLKYTGEAKEMKRGNCNNPLKLKGHQGVLFTTAPVCQKVPVNFKLGIPE